MAITSRIRPSYGWRMIILCVVCIVFGLWGIYDYVYSIPAAQQQYERYQVLELTRDALEATPGTVDYRKKMDAAKEVVLLQIVPIIDVASAEADVQVASVADPNYDQWLAALFVASGDPSMAPDQTQGVASNKASQVIAVVRNQKDFSWLKGMLLSRLALLQPRRAGSTLEGIPRLAYDFSKQHIDALGGVPKKPGKFDSLTQWAFILCLPCAPYFFYLCRRAKVKTYTLEDDGTLVTPEGRWTADQIKDIEMKRWMSKSVATVSTTSGTDVKLDDYLYKGMDKIVGAIAHKRYPNDWDENAKPLKDGQPIAGEEPAPLAPEDASEIPDSATIDPTDQT